MGDPAGIGPEVCVKALTKPEILSLCRPIIIGDARVITDALKIADIKVQINPLEDIVGAKFGPNFLNVIHLQNADPRKIKKGKVQAACGQAAYEYIIKAIELAKAKKVDAITTGPINKEALHKAGLKFDGHTEILAQGTKTKNYAMLFISDTIWVILATTHMALSKVPKSLNKNKILNAIQLGYKALVKAKKPNQKIAVAGLNPHAGENGIFGKEEIKIIRPAIEQAQKMGIKVEGPISPDAIFNLAKAGMYGLVVAMYHDQGLIPLKLLSFNRSVNVTVGLPFIRTSVDHGTGFNIAGKNMANPQSLVEAIKAAAHLSNR